MATSNSRDIKMTLNVETQGAEDVGALSNEVDNLAQAGKGVAPAFDRLNSELEALQAKTIELRKTEAAARAELVLQKQAREDQRDALARYRAESDKAARSTDAFKAQERDLRLAIINSRAALREKQAAVDSSTTAAKVAASAEQKLAEQIKAAAAAANQQAAANKRTDDSLKGMGRTANGLGDIFGQLGPIIAAAFTGREMVQTIAQTESLKLGLAAVLGGSQTAAAEWEFLKKTSSDLGLELQSTGQAYLSLTAATKGTAIEGAQTREVFTAISRAMSMLGKSSTETERALQAVSQMASKGTVSMEELRAQLGEALPGALKAAADGAGITTAQLIQMVSTGDVLAKDLLPALTKGLNAVYAGGAPPDTLTANFNRFKNSISETSIALGESGLTTALTDVAIVGAKTVGVLGESFVSLGKGIGKVAGAVATLDFGPLADDLGRATFSADQFGETAYDAMGNVIGVVNQLPPALGEVATGLDTTGRSAEAAGQAAQEGFRKTEIAAQNAANSVLKNAQVYGDLEIAVKKRLDLADKAVKAAEAEAKVVHLVAEAFGTEAEKRQAVVLASQLQADAQNKELGARREALKIAEQKLDQLNREIKGISELDEGQKKAKESLEQSVKVKTEEVRISEGQAKAYGITAAASSALAQAYKDNSARVYELRGAMVSAMEAARAKREEFAKGIATMEQVAAADLAAQRAAMLYRAALNDLVAVAKIREQQTAQKNVTQQKENDLNIEGITSTLELAKARGDDGTATRAQTALTEALVNAKRDAAAALHAEADAMRVSADAEEAAAKSAGDLTTEKTAQVEAIREAAKQKDIDARKSEILADREQQLAKSVDGTIDALERKNAALERLNAATEKAIALEDKRLNRDSQGYSIDPTTGKRVEIQMDNQRSVFENAKGQGLNDAQALQVSNRFITERGEKIGWNDGGRLGADQGATWSSAVQKAIDQLVLSNAANTPNATTSAPMQANKTTTVNIKIGGNTTPVNVSSSSDAQALKSVLRQLESAASTSA